MNSVIKAMFARKLVKSIYYFIMGDIYLFVEKYIEIATKWYNYMKEYRQPIAIINVNVNKSKNITKQYINNENWSEFLNENDIVHITWRYYDDVYKMCFSVSNPIPFPPYNLNVLNMSVTKKIMVMTIGDTTDEEIELLKQYAGPKHNFYCDVGGKMNIKWILDKDGYLDIIDTTGKFSKVDGKMLAT